MTFLEIMTGQTSNNQFWRPATDSEAVYDRRVRFLQAKFDTREFARSLRILSDHFAEERGSHSDLAIGELVHMPGGYMLFGK